ncbi:DNA-processing protein DprA [Helicobacter sp. MIT 21-1697]|uniref:DNA-processing protein DprA n=1 Tax=Helicobacter sp. MIT 21-1697 TaxID=2993733 RepID=UPI00224B20A6|nr:DNA-processing protein DprA [Helicobacter sp. MIT 21-1697]MCX2717119.1 DNA-processing protein DprA [Helicobacter sp. MIT 21-1697]
MIADIAPLENLPKAFEILTNPPQKLFYRGKNAAISTLLECEHKIAIVGTRKPNPYTKSFVATLANKIAHNNGVVVSGGALGVDIIAHTHAYPRTIMFSPASLEILYPKSNADMISKMMQECLVLSEYEKEYMPHKYSFLERNRLVIALSDKVIIPQADKQSGSMQSARIALELGKPLFVLPHRVGESEGTNALLASGEAQAIYDVNAFIESIFGAQSIIRDEDDEILRFCANNPSFEEAYERFGAKIYEYELEGKIIRESSFIRVP